MSEKIVIEVTLAPTSSVRFDADGEARIVLLADGTQLAASAQLLLHLGDRRLRATFEEIVE